MTRTLSLFDRLGGVPALETVVDDFYARVLADPELAPLFEGSNLARLKGRQVEFLASALGGPTPYTGASMAAVHAGRGIGARHFHLVAAHLTASLTAAGVDPLLVHDVIAVVATLQPDIVSIG